jgi:hypothetical protein
VQPARRLFVVAVAPQSLHYAQLAPLIRRPQDLFAVFSASADAVEDANRRDEACQVRFRPPFDSQHVAKTDLLSADSVD